MRILAETMASLLFAFYRQRADGGKGWVTDHWVYRFRFPDLGGVWR